jgi:secreted Zn-dependent insulinase-like peptidase
VGSTILKYLVLQNVRERSDRWWNELSTGRRAWNRPNDLAAAIRRVTQQQVLAFSELLVFNASSVSSWVVPASVNPGGKPSAFC